MMAFICLHYVHLVVHREQKEASLPSHWFCVGKRLFFSAHERCIHPMNKGSAVILKHSLCRWLHPLHCAIYICHLSSHKISEQILWDAYGSWINHEGTWSIGLHTELNTNTAQKEQLVELYLLLYLNHKSWESDQNQYSKGLNHKFLGNTDYHTSSFYACVLADAQQPKETICVKPVIPSSFITRNSLVIDTWAHGIMVTWLHGYLLKW